MPNYNLNAGYGKEVANLLTAQTSGKTFLVASATQPNISTLLDLFAPDTDGVQRVFTSITSALAACTASQGDTIYVAPGYTETVTSAGGLAVSTAGVSIIGLGTGSLRPTITFTTAVTASFNISAANTYIENFLFVCGIDNQTAMVNVTGAGVSFIKCEFTTNTATLGAALGILTAATASNLVVDGCRFI